VGKHARVVEQILSGTADANVAFDDLCHLLERLGFEVRIRGSHHLFRKSGIVERINLQRDGSKAKPYQVRQVRQILVKYNLAVEED
jgi:predicted RNA binding protein YcfA (HicA-like mRNA interferase family)